MKNIEICLKNDCSIGSGDIFRMYFGFEDCDEVAITTTSNKENTQHDFILNKEDYLHLRKLIDAHFNVDSSK